MSDSASGNPVPWANCDWLVFDAVGTLIHPTPSVAIAYQTIAARFGSRLTVEQIGERFRQAFRESELGIPDELTSGDRWLSSDAIEVARWRWIVDEVVPDVIDTERCFAELWDHFARPSSWACFEDVMSALAGLKQAGYRLAIASNFDSRLHAVCEGHDALSSIERRFVSSETGYRKPSPQFYSAIALQCGCPADRILMVGDDAEHDVAGPLAAGMQALLLDRRSANANGNSIRSLHQLMQERNDHPETTSNSTLKNR